MEKLQIDVIQPLAKIGHAASNKWQRENHHPPYPEWNELMEIDRVLRCERVEKILKGEHEELLGEELAFAKAITEKANEWHLL